MTIARLFACIVVTGASLPAYAAPDVNDTNASYTVEETLECDNCWYREQDLDRFIAEGVNGCLYARHIPRDPGWDYDNTTCKYRIDRFVILHDNQNFLKVKVKSTMEGYSNEYIWIYLRFEFQPGAQIDLPWFDCGDCQAGDLKWIHIDVTLPNGQQIFRSYHADQEELATEPDASRPEPNSGGLPYPDGHPMHPDNQTPPPDTGGDGGTGGTGGTGGGLGGDGPCTGKWGGGTHNDFQAIVIPPYLLTVDPDPPPGLLRP